MKILLVLMLSSITLLWQEACGPAPRTRALVFEFIELIRDDVLDADLQKLKKNGCCRGSEILRCSTAFS